MTDGLARMETDEWGGIVVSCGRCGEQVVMPYTSPERDTVSIVKHGGLVIAAVALPALLHIVCPDDPQRRTTTPVMEL